jgi:hypothetical protein
MELRANIEGHEAGVTYDIKRLVEFALWEKVGGKWIFEGHEGPKDDDPDNYDMPDTQPSSRAYLFP